MPTHKRRHPHAHTPAPQCAAQVLSACEAAHVIQLPQEDEAVLMPADLKRLAGAAGVPVNAVPATNSGACAGGLRWGCSFMRAWDLGMVCAVRLGAARE